MRVLEARFRSRSDEPFLVVGHVVWLGSPASQPSHVRPAASLADQEGAAAFISKLEYLVASTAPDCFEGLQQLGSSFWSFVEVAAGP
jgi:hypothetical protein